MNQQIPTDPDVTIVLSPAEKKKLADKWQNAPSEELLGNAVLKSIDSEFAAGSRDEEDPEAVKRLIAAIRQRYQLERQFAEGGFGRIFEAEDLILKRKVAIKSLREELREKPEAVGKFIAEARLTAQLDHPSIVPVYGLEFDDAGNLCLAMKLVNGITFREFMVRLRAKYNMGRVAVSTEHKALRSRLEYFIRICETVEFAHSRDIVHGDLKPANVMIGAHGEIYVMDWGSAVHLGGEDHGGLEGTISYIAPEIFLSGKPSKSGDVFALGMILYELVGLQPSQPSGQDSELLKAKAIRGEHEALTHVHAGLKIDPPIRAVVEKALAADPADRYASVRELRRDVHNYIFHEELAARPDHLPTRIGRWMMNHRSTSVGVFSGFLLLLSFLSAYSFYRQTAIEKELNIRMQQRLKLQRDTDSLASAVDRMLLSVLGDINAFSIIAVQELEKAAPAESTERIYRNEDFREPDTAPPDFAYSPSYDQMVSLKDLNYFLPESVDESELRLAASRLDVLRRIGFGMLISRTDEDDESAKAKIDAFLQHGGPIRKIILFLENGIAIAYPGLYLDFNLHLAGLQWSHSFEKKNGSSYWGMPYAGRDGMQLLSYWNTLTGSRNQPLGKIGVEIDFGRILNMIDASAEDDLPGSLFYLVNSRDQVIASNDPALSLPLATGATPDQSNLPRFEYAHLLRNIHAAAIRQAQLEIGGEPHIVSYSPIKSLNWNFFQLVPRKSLDQAATIRIELEELAR